jgi:antitoxin component YwqK of YwqJK toxin-antitoxin module
LNHYGDNWFEWKDLLRPDALEWREYTETNYLNGKKEGLYESYYHGLITTRIYYSNDVYNGNYEEYDAEGNLTNLRKYINGRLTE